MNGHQWTREHQRLFEAEIRFCGYVWDGERWALIHPLERFQRSPLKTNWAAWSYRYELFAALEQAKAEAR